MPDRIGRDLGPRPVQIGGNNRYNEYANDLKYQEEMALCRYFETKDGIQLWGLDESIVLNPNNGSMQGGRHANPSEVYREREGQPQNIAQDYVHENIFQDFNDMNHDPNQTRVQYKDPDETQDEDEEEEEEDLFVSNVFGQIRTAADDEESHIYNDKAYEEFGYGDIGTYIKNKRLKLQINDRETVRARLEYERHLEQENASEDTAEKDIPLGQDKYPQIFKDKSIYLNGHTDPPPVAIHRMIILHGGIFIDNPAAIGGISKVDYIVCGQVAAGKKQKWINAGYRLVRPEWVVESIKARRILNWGQFRVVNIADSTKTNPLNFQPLKNDQAKDVSNNGNNLVMTTNTVTATAANMVTATATATTTEKRKILTTDPDFIAHYYSKSRLHHLSTWKANLKREFQRRVLSVSSQRVGSSSSLSSSSTPLSPLNINYPIILHVDLDCFFASVALLERPHISPTSPVGVSHGAKHSSVASCNYVARGFGVSNGMLVGRARQLCPGLILVPYDFEAYERASRAFYDVVLGINARLVYPVSVDEVLMDVTNVVEAELSELNENGLVVITRQNIDTVCTRLGKTIRDRVRIATGGCEVSIGGSVNVLLAKLCLRRAKPQGQFFLFPHDVAQDHHHIQDNLDQYNIDIEINAGPVNGIERGIVADTGIRQFLAPLELKNLPGVGSSIVKTLAPLVNINQLRQTSLRHLTQTLGAKRALSLYWAARGVDRSNIDLRKVSQRELIQSMKQKAVSVEISWGVRLNSDADVRIFVENLCKEVVQRMKLEGDNCGGRRISVKLYKTIYSEKELARLMVTDNNNDIVGDDEISEISSEEDNDDDDDDGNNGQSKDIIIPSAGYRKPMGHGPCTYHVKATTVPLATNDLNEIVRICWSNITSFGFKATEIRGVGISIALLQDLTPGHDQGVDKAQPSVLQFFLKKGATIKPKALVPVPRSKPLATQEVDWDVFEALPASLRTELIDNNIVVNRVDEAIASSQGGVVDTPQPVSTPLSSYRRGDKVILASDDIDWGAFSQFTSSIKRDIAQNRFNVDVVTPTPGERERTPCSPGHEERINRPIFKTPSPEPEEPLGGDISTNTQFVDSQVFRELPSFIQREIIDERQRKRHYRNPPLLNNSQIPIDFTSTPQASDIDWTMFDMLPRSMQREILTRYKLSQPQTVNKKGPADPTTSKAMVSIVSPQKPRGFTKRVLSVPTTPTKPVRPGLIDVSPINKKKISIVSPQKPPGGVITRIVSAPTTPTKRKPQPQPPSSKLVDFNRAKAGTIGTKGKAPMTTNDNDNDNKDNGDDKDNDDMFIDDDLRGYIERESIDMGIFRQLPLDIQRDQIMAWRRRQRALRPDHYPNPMMLANMNSRPEPGRISLLNRLGGAATTTEKRRTSSLLLFPGISKEDGPPSLQYRGKVMILIAQWVDSGRPRDKDIDIIERWLKWCVLSQDSGGDWGLAYDVVRWLDRQIFGKIDNTNNENKELLASRVVMKWCQVLSRWRALVQRGANKHGVMGELFNHD